MFVGTLQLTVRLFTVDVETVGAEGLPGASVTSVTVTLSVSLAVNAREPVPPVAVTITIYSLFSAALLFAVLVASVKATSVGDS